MKSITDNLNLSLIELLSVLLPGATGLLFLNKIGFIQEVYTKMLPDNSEWIKGIIFFGASYFIGYVIYVSSSFLDNFYTRIKRKALKLDSEENKKKGLHLFLLYPTKNRAEVNY